MTDCLYRVDVRDHHGPAGGWFTREEALALIERQATPACARAALNLAAVSRGFRTGVPGADLAVTARSVGAAEPLSRYVCAECGIDSEGEAETVDGLCPVCWEVHPDRGRERRAGAADAAWAALRAMGADVRSTATATGSPLSQGPRGPFGVGDYVAYVIDQHSAECVGHAPGTVIVGEVVHVDYGAGLLTLAVDDGRPFRDEWGVSFDYAQPVVGVGR